MALKTFNLDEKIYKKFSEYCKKEGISMSKRIENFLRQELERIKLGREMGRGREQKVLGGGEEKHSFSKYCH